MKSPRQRFQDTINAKAFYEMSNTEPFVEALDAALLQMVNDLPAAPEATSAAANAYRIQGAKLFISQLITLPLVEPERKPMTFRDNLEP